MSEPTPDTPVPDATSPRELPADATPAAPPSPGVPEAVDTPPEVLPPRAPSGSGVVPPAANPVVRSPAQRAASRGNGAHSRGPVTDAGKAVSRRNAFKHGMCAKALPLRPELIVEREDFDALLAGLLEDFAPQCQLAVTLVESLAVDFCWLGKMQEMRGAALHPPESQAQLDLQAQQREKARQRMTDPRQRVDPEDPRRAMRVLQEALKAAEEHRPVKAAEADLEWLVDDTARTLGRLQMLPRKRKLAGRRIVVDLSVWLDPAQQAIAFTPKNLGCASIAGCTARFRTARPRLDERPQLLWRWFLLHRIRDFPAETAARGINYEGAAAQMKRQLTAFIRLPRLETLNRYEAHVRRNIERTLRTLYLLEKTSFPTRAASAVEGGQ